MRTVGKKIRLMVPKEAARRGHGLTESMRAWKAIHCVARDGLLSLVGAGIAATESMSTSSVPVFIGEAVVRCAATLMMFLGSRIVVRALVE